MAIAGRRSGPGLTMQPVWLESELETLVYWMRERERIRAAKARGDARPWTKDPLLRDYRWCNVQRMDDAVSQAMLRDWYHPDHDLPTSLVAACLGRLVNWPESLMAITSGRPFELAHLVHARAALDERSRRGLKVFTGAYVIPGKPGEPKIHTVVAHAEFVAAHAHELASDTMMRTWRALTRIDGLGSFLAGQMVTDVAYLAAGACWQDRKVWAPLGPGSARGIDRLLGRNKNQALSQAEFDALLPQLMLVLQHRLPEIWADRRMDGMAVQNCACEFDKYRRLQLGEGKVRARYAGAAAHQHVLL